MLITINSSKKFQEMDFYFALFFIINFFFEQILISGKSMHLIESFGKVL